MTTKILTFAEGCRLLRVSRSHAERLLRAPGSDFVRPFWIGARRFYRLQDLRSYVERKATATLQAAYIARNTRQSATQIHGCHDHVRELGGPETKCKR